MNNFINARIQVVKNFEGSLNHNLRMNEILSQLNTNENMIVSFENGQPEQFNFNYIKNTDLENLSVQEQNDYHTNRSKILNTFRTFKNNVESDRIEHNTRYKAKYKKNLTEEVFSYAEGVFTFSDQLKVDLENGTITKQQLLDVGVQAAQDLCNILETDLQYVVLHLDETSPHLHLGFKNYNIEGNSVVNNVNIKKQLLKNSIKCDDTKETLKYIQDIAHKHFGEAFGMDRGISKDITKSSYKKASVYNDEINQQHQLEINALIEEKNKIRNEINMAKNDYKTLTGIDFENNEDFEKWKIIQNQYLTSLRNQESDIKKAIIEQKTKFNQQVDTFQERMDFANKIIRTSLEIQDNESKSGRAFAERILELKNQSENMIGLFNPEKFVKLLEDEFENMAKIKSQTKATQSTLSLVQDQVSTYKRDYEALKSKSNNVFVFEETIKTLKDENSTQKTKISDLESDLKKKTEENTKNKELADKYNALVSKAQAKKKSSRVTTQFGTKTISETITNTDLENELEDIK